MPSIEIRKNSLITVWLLWYNAVTITIVVTIAIVPQPCVSMVRNQVELSTSEIWLPAVPMSTLSTWFDITRYVML